MSEEVRLIVLIPTEFGFHSQRFTFGRDVAIDILRRQIARVES
jgi:hypothetical protein